MDLVKSFADITSLFDDLPDHAPGKWFWLLEHEILTQRNKQFANKTGKRPVILARVAGPNAIVYPRSSSSGRGLEHGAHTHRVTGCIIDRDGYVPLDCPCTIRVEVFSSQTFSCFEPEGSLLMTKLAEVGAA